MFCSEVAYTLVPDAHQFAKNLEVSLFDCGAMTENTIYAPNQVRQCHLKLEELEISQRKIILYTKHFRKELNATKCWIRHQHERWYSGHDHHSSINQSITNDLVISTEQCRSLAKGKIIYLADQSSLSTIQKVVSLSQTVPPVALTEIIVTDTVGQLVKRSPLLPWTTLKARRSTREDLFDSTQVLPSALEELGCGTTSLDPFAYKWDYPDNSALSVLRTENVNMVKQGTKYYIRRGHDSTTKFVFLNNNPKNIVKIQQKFIRPIVTPFKPQ